MPATIAAMDATGARGRSRAPRCSADRRSKRPRDRH
jgi:hypothetical protein